MALKSAVVALSSDVPAVMQTQIDAALGALSITASTVPTFQVIGLPPRPYLVIIYDEAAE